MNTAHTIRFVTTVHRDQALLKSILATFGHQRNADWRYQSEGAVNVIILDSDELQQHLLVKEQDYTKPRLDAVSDAQLQRHTLAYS